MKKLYAILLTFLIGTSITQAGDWRKKYMADEFGDADYSKPVYVIECSNPDDYLIQIEITYVNGAFVLYPVYYSAEVNEATTIKAKGANGKVYQFDFTKPHNNSSLHLISNESDVENLINLLEQGNFTLSFHRPANYVEGAYNYNFKIGRQGQGIRQLYDSEHPKRKKKLTYEPNEDPYVYKGTLGPNQITMLLDQIPEFTDNPEVFKISGTFWYGEQKNLQYYLTGTMTTKDFVLYKYHLEAYSPEGTMSGTLDLTENTNSPGLTGMIKDLKGTNLKVVLKQQ